jgi:hypothetical protein
MTKRKRRPDLRVAPEGGGVDYERWLKEARERRARALAMREAGKSVQEVGDALGVSKQRASELITQARRDAQTRP